MTTIEQKLKQLLGELQFQVVAQVQQIEELNAKIVAFEKEKEVVEDKEE